MFRADLKELGVEAAELQDPLARTAKKLERWDPADESLGDDTEGNRDRMP